MNYSSIIKAEYLFQPRVLCRRLFGRRTVDGPQEVRLPWGRRIRVDTRDNIGAPIATLGVFDLVVTESLWRLIDPSDLVIDIGANIGCMAAVMCERIGEHGRVIAFEPHPILFAELQANADRLAAQGVCRIDARAVALGAERGELPLNVPKEFQLHRGECSLREQSESPAGRILVPVDTLDQVLGDSAVGLIKIDVEGFEAAVLEGGRNLFGRRAVRDCIFEEHADFPTPVTNRLEAWGYTLFRLDRLLTRPLVANPRQRRATSGVKWEATSYLATIEPARALDRLGRRGWQCLRNTHRKLSRRI